MSKKIVRSVKATLVSIAVVVSSLPLSSVAAAATTSNFNYGTALRDAICFYDANKCGTDAGIDNVFDWRDACHTQDGSDVGHDLTGGYHDCGDHVKFGQTQGYAASILGWSYYRYKDTFELTGNSDKMLQELKHFTD